MQKQFILSIAAKTLAIAILGHLAFTNLALADDSGKQPLDLKLPDPTLKGTPEDMPKNPLVEPIPDKPPVFMVPAGVTNIALHKPVTSSVPAMTGELSQVTDGHKEATDEETMEMKKGVQWVQVDLGASVPIYAIVVWHDHRFIQIVHDVIVEVSDDPEFKKDVTILFNNDRENKNGLGAEKIVIILRRTAGRSSMPKASKRVMCAAIPTAAAAAV